MSQALQTPLPAGATIVPGSLRAELEARRGAGKTFTIREAIGVVVPLCTRLAELHAQGKNFYVHPSSLSFTPDGQAFVLEDRAHTAPSLPRDRSCLAPEERKGNAEGDARASVFAIGAMLYELLTNTVVGPGMRRPSELVPDMPAALETILGKALVADPKHRPGDLGALAQALHHVAPGSSIAPPPADEGRLDSGTDFEVDVRLSMIPPSERQAIPKAAAVPRFQADGPYRVMEAQPQNGAAVNPADPTRRLADMKAALESDPRPRYVVAKEGMDHGPFSAVELLQQIASGQFTADNVLRDTFTTEERFIKEWEEFAPFAEQAKLNREIVQEKKQLEAVVSAEKQGTQYKALIGVAVIGVFAAGAAGLWLRDRANRDAKQEVQGDVGVAVEVDGGLAARKGTLAPGQGGPMPGGGGVGAGNHPVLAGGMSCEGARAKYIEDYDKAAPPDLSAGAYGNVLNKGTYLNSCGVPSNMAVTICAAVQNGRAVGVTVTTNPPNRGVSSCVSGAVRSLSFPAHPRLDVTTTTFAAN
jgi:hypothetical protein